MKDIYSSDTQKCTTEVTGNSAQTAQNICKRAECTIVENFCIYCKKPHKTGNKKICKGYKIEATVQNKMRLDKCGVFTATETLGYRRIKFYVPVAREAAKREAKRDRRRNKPTDKL